MLPAMRTGIWIAIWLMICTSGSAFAAIINTHTRISGNLEELTLQSTAQLKVQQSFTLANPPRLVIDIARLSHGNGAQLGDRYRGRVLKNLRFGQFDADTSRLVLDLAATDLEYQVFAEGKRLRITLKNTGNALPTRRPSSGRAVNFPTPVPKPSHLAKQSQRPIIVIDAGHGGKDSGAIGRRSGTAEKRITLDYARALRRALLKTGRYRVVMTRDSDQYLFLNERVALARRSQGDAFLSIHADSNPRSDASGLSVYTLSEKASDSEAAALAAQENKADIIGGLDLSTEDAAVANILIDLAQRETNNKSAHLAETLIRAMDKRIPLLKNSHRYAGFRVLKAPDIPSVLIEIGFLSNRHDEQRMRTPPYRAQVTSSIVRALDAFFGK